MPRFRIVFTLTLVTVLLFTTVAPLGADAAGRSITVAELLQRSQPMPAETAPPAEPRPAPEEPAAPGPEPQDPVPPAQPQDPGATTPRSSGRWVSVSDLLHRSGFESTVPAQPEEPAPPAQLAPPAQPQAPEEPSQPQQPTEPQPQPAPPTSGRWVSVGDLLNPPRQVTPPSPSTGFGQLPPLPAGLSSDESEMLQLLNKERLAAGVPPVIVDMELVRLARMKAEEIAELNYNGHTSPTYGPPTYMARQAGVQFNRLGETIVKAGSVLKGHKLLMGSMAHRNIMLNPNYTRVGIGIAYYNGRHNINGLVAVTLFAD